MPQDLSVIKQPLRSVALLGAACCFIGAFWWPYHVPVAPAVSLSYATGFNNRAALLLLLSAFGLACLGTDGSSVFTRTRNRRLPMWTLALVVLLTSLACVAWRRHNVRRGTGQESPYLVDRQVHVAEGARPYRDVEYVYGPLLLYPGVLLERSFHLRALHAYLLIWLAGSTLGAAMLWCVVAWLPLPNPRRWLVLAFLLLNSFLDLSLEGLQYTPFRSTWAAFCALGIGLYWRRTHQDTGTAALMAAAILGGFAISPEQGIGLGLGLPAYALLLTLTSPQQFRRSLSAGVALASLATGGLAWWAGELQTAAGLAQGGLSFPLLPSIVNVLVLSLYAAAVLVVYRHARQRAWDHPCLPLGLCGLAMFSSALGRCDPGHLASVLPLYVIGLFWVTAQRWSVIPWVALSVYLFPPSGALLHRLVVPQHFTTAATVRPSPVTVPSLCLTIPENRPYFAPLYVPAGIDGHPRWHAATGRFFGLQDVLTPADGRFKAQEIEARQSPFLLLPDQPGAPRVEFWPTEEDIRYTAALEGSWWAPPVRHTLPVKMELRAVILRLYEPTASCEAGWRVWALRSQTTP